MKLSEISNFNEISDFILKPKYKHYPKKVKEFIKSKMRHPENFNENTEHTASGDIGFVWDTTKNDYYIMAEVDFSSIPNEEEEITFISSCGSKKITIINLNANQDFIDLHEHKEDVRNMEKITYAMLPRWINSFVKIELSKNGNTYSDRTRLVSGKTDSGFNFVDSVIGYDFWRLVYDLEFKKAFRKYYHKDYVLNELNINNGSYTYEVMNYNNKWRVKVENN